MSKRKAYDFEERRFWWPILNVNQRFLSSDFLANYSRGYVWAANQLGHFTLGLIGALSYFWIADTLYRAFSNLGALRSGGAGLQPLDESNTADLLLAGFAALILCGVIAGLGLIALRLIRKPLRLRRHAKLREARIEAARAAGREIPPAAFEMLKVSQNRLYRELAERAGLLIGLLALLAVAGLVIALSFSQNIRGAFEWRAYAGSVIVTTLFFAALAALLSQSARYTLMSWTVLGAAALMWEPRALDAAGAHVTAPITPPEELSFVSEAPLVALLAIIFFVQMLFLRVRDSYGRAPWRLILIIALFFLIGAMTPDPEIRRAVAAGFASLGVWWVKEFGSDLPTVEDELQDAHDARVANGQSGWNGVSHLEDFADVRRECFDDTLCDARSDGLFYFAGATMAGALLISPSVIDVEASSVVPAFGAALLFVAIYWGVGWHWMRRAVALDRVSVLASERFAMLESAVVAKLTIGGREVNPQNAEETPRGAMQRLRAYASGELALGSGAQRQAVRHLVICGAFGVGRSALGHAVACEAALVNAPPWSAAPERRTKEKLRWARYVTMRGVFERFVFDTRDDFAGDPELVARRGAPDLFVIDQADPFALETVEAFRAWSAHNPQEQEAEAADALARAAHGAPAGTGSANGPETARARLLSAFLKLLKIEVVGQRPQTPAPDQTTWIDRKSVV